MWSWENIEPLLIVSFEFVYLSSYLYIYSYSIQSIHLINSQVFFATNKKSLIPLKIVLVCMSIYTSLYLFYLWYPSYHPSVWLHAKVFPQLQNCAGGVLVQINTGGGVFLDKNTWSPSEEVFFSCLLEKQLLRRSSSGVGNFGGRPSSGGGVFLPHYGIEKHLAVFLPCSGGQVHCLTRPVALSGG